MKRLLLRESQVQPLLLVFEDLHWIDDATQEFLDSLVDSLSRARLYRVGRDKEAEAAFGQAVHIIEAIAATLTTPSLRRGLLRAEPVLKVYRSVGRRLPGGDDPGGSSSG